MIKLARPFLLFSLFLVAVPVGIGQEKSEKTKEKTTEKTIEEPYYPLTVGTTWHYKTGDNKAVVMKVGAPQMVGDVLCSRIEIPKDGAKKEPDYVLVAVTADGVYRYAANGSTPDKPMLIFKRPLKAGDSWTVDTKAFGETIKGTFKVGEEKEVKVPEGAYKAFSVTCEDLEVGGRFRGSCVQYYAAGRGLIYQQTEIGKDKATIELEKFEAGKK